MCTSWPVHIYELIYVYILVCRYTCVRVCMYVYELARSHIRADLRIYPGVQVHRVGRDGGDEVLDDEVVETALLAVELG